MNSCQKSDLGKICISILGNDRSSIDIYNIVTVFCNNVHIGGLCPNADVIFARPADLERVVIPVLPLIVYGTHQEFKNITLKSLQSLTKQKFELLLTPTDVEEVIKRIRLSLCYDHPVSQALKNLNYSTVSSSVVGISDSGIQLHHAVREQR